MNSYSGVSRMLNSGKKNKKSCHLCSQAKKSQTIWNFLCFSNAYNSLKRTNDMSPWGYTINDDLLPWLVGQSCTKGLHSVLEGLQSGILIHVFL